MDEEITPLRMMKPDTDDFAGRFGTWVECRLCHALMYDTFDTCWSCGSPMTPRNAVPVRL